MKKAGSTLLETLLSSESIADFLNQAENISKISEYDRDMLKKYEDTQASIQEHEQKVEEESASISALLTEKSAKQQEVQSMVDSTSSNISSYISQISASQEEANALMAQVNSADSSIYTLMQQAAARKRLRRKKPLQKTHRTRYMKSRNLIRRQIPWIPRAALPAVTLLWRRKLRKVLVKIPMTNLMRNPMRILQDERAISE